MTSTPLSPSRLWAEPDGHHMHALRNPWYRVLAETQSRVTELTVEFWQARGGRTLHLPITTGSISSPMGLGSDSLPVRVDLQGTPTYLADSMQFMLEYGCRMTGKDCYYVMPSFRGENTDSSHLSQFFHSEAEIRGGLDDVLVVVEQYLTALAGGLLASSADDIAAMGGDLAAIEQLASGRRFERLTYAEAAVIAGESGIRQHDSWSTLTRDGERTVMDKVGEFVWISHWDHLAVPFYQAFGDEHKKTALNADLLFGVGEVVGAGERHVTVEQVREALTLHEVGEAPYSWYCDIRTLEELQTSGFGLGIERFLMWLFQHDDIRDMQLLPRENGKNIVP